MKIAVTVTKMKTTGKIKCRTKTLLNRWQRGRLREGITFIFFTGNECIGYVINIRARQGLNQCIGLIYSWLVDITNTYLAGCRTISRFSITPEGWQMLQFMCRFRCVRCFNLFPSKNKHKTYLVSVATWTLINIVMSLLFVRIVGSRGCLCSSIPCNDTQLGDSSVSSQRHKTRSLFRIFCTHKPPPTNVACLFIYFPVFTCGRKRK